MDMPSILRWPRPLPDRHRSLVQKGQEAKTQGIKKREGEFVRTWDGIGGVEEMEFESEETVSEHRTPLLTIGPA
jgi:hypothetical protein